MEYRFNTGMWGSVFAVPNTIVDTYIKTASGNAVKLLLFLLRNSEKKFDEETLKSALAFKSMDDVNDALDFWKERGLVDYSGGLVIRKQPITLSHVTDTPVVTNEQLTFELKKHDSVRKVDASRPIRYSAKEIGESIKGSAQMEHLFTRAEQLCGRPLKNSEQQMIMSIVDYEGLNCDVASMLIEYCYSIGKTTPKYIQTLAAEWNESEINTIALAEEKISKLRSYNTVETQLKRDLEFCSAFSQNQKEFIDNWSNRMGFSVEMIELAYQMTMDSTGKASFPYMNKIIESWQQKGISTPQQVEQEKQNHKRENDTTSSFDVGDLEKKALEKYRRQ